MLQVIFGDDEHTASEGVYSRLMKARKWVYLSAGFATVMSLHLYQETAALELVKVVSLPFPVLQTAALFGLVYILAQYGLLCWQLGVTYDITLRERLQFRREEEENEARNRVEMARRELAQRDSIPPSVEAEQIRDRMSPLEMMLPDEEQNLLTLQRAFQEEFPGGTAGLHINQPRFNERHANLDRAGVSVATMRSQLHNLRHQLSSAETMAGAAVEVRASLVRSVEEAGEALARVQKNDPAKRSGFEVTEVAIDLFRIGTPALFGLAASINLAISMIAP